jgi:glucose/arabinose dehydrogenase
VLAATQALAQAVGPAVPPAGAQASDYRIDTIASGLAHPWSLAFLPDALAALLLVTGPVGMAVSAALISALAPMGVALP